MVGLNYFRSYLDYAGRIMYEKVNESVLLIKLEDITQVWIKLKKEPDTFFREFARLLLQFKKINHPNYRYFGCINAWRDFLNENDIVGLTFSELVEYLQAKSFQEYQKYFMHYKSRHLYALRRHRADEKRNKESLKEKVQEAIQHYSKSEVVRVDLSYLQKSQDSIGLEDFYDDMEELRKGIGKRVEPFDHLVDYAWALEQGRTKGYHCHLLLIFNGHKKQAAWGIAKQVGDYWKGITGNEGCYFNCHDPDQLEQYKKLNILGVGRIHRDNEEEVDRLLNAVTYLVRPEKEEQHLRIKPFFRMRTYQ